VVRVCVKDLKETQETMRYHTHAVTNSIRIRLE